MSARGKIQEIIAAQVDVKVVHRLILCDHREGLRWLYLIETPFQTFPQFVVGWTDDEGGEVRHVIKCGLLNTAVEAFDRALGEARCGIEVIRTAVRNSEISLPTWQRGEPPHNLGRAVIIVGQLVCEAEDGGWVEPVCAEAIWNETESYTGWLFASNRLAIAQSLEDELKIFFWSEQPREGEES